MSDNNHLVHPAVAYECVPVDIALREAGPEIGAVRAIHRLDGVIASAVAEIHKLVPAEVDTVNVDVSRCSVRRVGASTDDDWTVNHRVAGVQAVMTLEQSYANLARLCEASVYYGDQLDGWLRRQYRVPPEVPAYVAQSVYGVKNWVVSVTTGRVVAVRYQA